MLFTAAQSMVRFDLAISHNDRAVIRKAWSGWETYRFALAIVRANIAAELSGDHILICFNIIKMSISH